MSSDDDDLIGRDEDVARLRSLLAGPARLITIVGAAGIGKTRLALELARLEDAVVARLTDARTIDDILATVGATIGVSPAATDRQATDARVARAVASSDRLLVLDNFEQLAPLAAETIGRWLASGPDARIVVTSREVLRLDGEWVHEVAPLAVVASEPADAPAVRLLRSRIARARGTPAEDAIADLVEIARRLDGIPLALELAAQRVAVFGAVPVLARLGSRLDFLSDGRRDVAADRRTLRDTIAWSWSLLGAHERSALAQCAVFPGSFDAEAAEHVLELDGDVLASLQALRDKSLIIGDAAANARFRLLLPIREFARDQLADADAERAHQRHAAYMLERAERRAAELDELSLLAALERDRADLVDILARAQQAGPAARDTVCRAVRAIAPLVLARGPVQPLLDTLAAIAPADELSAAGGTAVDLALLHGRVLRRVGRMADAEALFTRLLERGLAPIARLHGEIAYCQYSAGRIRDAIDGWARARRVRAEARSDDTDGEGSDLVRTAFALRELGRLDDVEMLATEARAIAQRRGHAGAEATALTILSVLACDRGAAARALRLGREAVELARATASSFFEGLALSALAMAHHLGDELAEAETALRQCQAHSAAVGLCRLDAGALTFLGIVGWEQGDLQAARARLQDALDIYRAIGDTRYTAHTIAVLGALEADEGHLAAAAHRFAELPADDGLPVSAAISIHRLHLPLAEARAADLAGRADDAERLREQVRAQLADVPPSYEALIARRLCRDAFEHGAPSLIVRDGGETWQIGDRTIDLSRRASARALLATLAERRLAHPGQPVSWSELMSAGWPAERMLPHAARNRVKVTISWLRSAGFRALIESDERGYWLRRSCRVTGLSGD